jgi:hypothetical protein
MIALSCTLGPFLHKTKEFPNQKILCIDDHIGDDAPSHKLGVDIINNLIKSKKYQQIIIEYLNHEEVCESAMRLPTQAYYTSVAFNTHFDLSYQKIQKHQAFNFMINKLRPNRRWLVNELIQRRLFTDCYTLSSDEFLEIPLKCYVDHKCKLNSNLDYIEYSAISNIRNYSKWLKANVFDPSYISLITEPTWEFESSMITEKTVFAFESLTIPIWIGGYKIAEQLQSLGFDVFQDLVDHSYQYKKDHVCRMQQAIELNMNLLTNTALLQDFYNKNINRFIKNKELMFSNKWFYNRFEAESQRVGLTKFEKFSIEKRLLHDHNYELLMDFT